jgi:hypothetical protein
MLRVTLRVIAILRMYVVVVFVCLLTCHRRNPFQFFPKHKKRHGAFFVFFGCSRLLFCV